MLSVIIPVYNSASMLADCLNALARSEGVEFECIVVDDSSTDTSVRVAEMAGARVLRLTGGPFGPGYARNQAAQDAQGDESALLVEREACLVEQRNIRPAHE